VKPDDVDDVMLGAAERGRAFAVRAVADPAMLILLRSSLEAWSWWLHWPAEAADGVAVKDIVARVGVSKPTVIGWKKRYAAEGIGELADRPKPGRRHHVSSTHAERHACSRLPSNVGHAVTRRREHKGVIGSAVDGPSTLPCRGRRPAPITASPTRNGG
jgi:Winged helix-turn helix